VLAECLLQIEGVLFHHQSELTLGMPRTVLFYGVIVTCNPIVTVPSHHKGVRARHIHYSSRAWTVQDHDFSTYVLLF